MKYGLLGTIMRIIYLLIDGFAPVITLGIVLWSVSEAELHKQGLVIGLVIIFILTMMQYGFLVQGGHIPQDNKKFLLFFLEPVVFVVGSALWFDSSIITSWVSFMIFLLLGRTFGHLAAAFLSPFFISSISTADKTRYWRKSLPPAFALILCIAYPLVIGVWYVFNAQWQEQTSLTGWGPWIGLVLLAIGIIQLSIRYARLFDPKSFIEYVLTTKDL